MSIKILFYKENQAHSARALKFLAEIFCNIASSVNLIAVDVFGSRVPIENYLKKDAAYLSKRGFQEVKYKFFSGSANKVIQQEMQKNSKGLLVKSVPKVNPIIEGMVEKYIDDAGENLIAKLNHSLFLIKNPPRKLYKVLICVDDSANARGAVNFFDNLKLKKAPLIKILNVIPDTFLFFKSHLEPSAESGLKILTTIKNHRTKYLYQARDILAQHGLKSKIKLRAGNVAEQILKEAKRDFDLIVIGLRGRRTKEKIPGRHAREILLKAKTSVLIIKSD